MPIADIQAYFVSDLHLSSSSDARAALFLDFLGELEQSGTATHLFLMGDIFDLWVGDHQYFIERYRPIIDAIERLKNQGVEVHYFEGNHDLYLDCFWGKQLGITVHADPAVFRLGDRVVRIEHGDQMDPDDRGYLFLRWLLRTPPIRFLNTHLPGALIVRIGERASEKSRIHSSGKREISESDAIRKIRTHARKMRSESNFELIVSGHVHVRDDFEFETGQGRARSVNLGTWLTGPCYFRLDDTGGELVELNRN